MLEEQQPLISQRKRKKTRQILLLTPLILLVVACTSPIVLFIPTFQFSFYSFHWFSREAELSFLVVGDWGRNGHYHQKSVAKAMAALSRRARPSFIISTGDNFYEDGVESVHDKQWNVSFEQVYDFLPLKSVPWYVVLGNHDHLGNYTAQLVYSHRSDRWIMPHPFYSVPLVSRTGLTYDFLFLDTTPFIQDSYGNVARKIGKQNWRLQLAWLEQELNRSSSHHIFVVGHHNMFSSSIAGERGSEELRTLVKPLLDKYAFRISAYISGHEHSLQHLQPDGINGMDHFISGGGSRIDHLQDAPKNTQKHWYSCCKVLPYKVENEQDPRSLFRESTHGFFMFQLFSNEMTVEAFNRKGRRLYVYRKAFHKTK
eukprot:jgi/Galph1/5172/GphlegSOOS_G3850.1